MSINAALPQYSYHFFLGNHRPNTGFNLPGVCVSNPPGGSPFVLRAGQR
jgi:hypothetical protein